MPEYQYEGSELELFADAVHWKSYWASKVRPYLSGPILEVGAGIGANTVLLGSPGREKWTCLEPDARLLNELRRGVEAGKPGLECEFVCGTVENLPPGESYGAAIYIDVMEHIEDDWAEAKRAAERLRPGGHLVVLSPAHQFLFSPFDRAIGHYRRYNKRTLRRLRAPRMREVAILYLDSVGMLLSAANRLLLRQSMPTKKQLGVWDRFIVPVSRLIDPILGHQLGKTIIGVWRKEEHGE